MKKSIVISFAFMLLCAVAAFAQKPKVVVSDKEGWMKIGEVTTDFKTMNETISVLGADKFVALKFKATDAPIKIEKAIVAYESGLNEEISVSQELKIGEETKAYDLKSADDIKTIKFTYSTMPSYKSEKAHVEIHGRK